MRIAIGSAFRNSGNTLARYCGQVAALQKHVGPEHPVRIIACDGDSYDHTREQLPVLAPVPLQQIHHDHGFPWFGSVVTEDRFREMSKIGNLIFEAVTEDDDVFIFVESDLIWTSDTLATLALMAERRDSGFDVFSPITYAGRAHYDIWGVRGLDGECWGPFEPYHKDANKGFTELSSTGSCLAMRGEVARHVRIRNSGCLADWCQDALSQGFRIAIHSDLRVDHPC